jgi:hypothetical protein
MYNGQRGALFEGGGAEAATTNNTASIDLSRFPISVKSIIQCEHYLEDFLEKDP